MNHIYPESVTQPKHARHEMAGRAQLTSLDTLLSLRLLPSGR